MTFDGGLNLDAEGGCKSIIVIEVKGCLCRIYWSSAFPVKPQPPVMRVGGSAGGLRRWLKEDAGVVIELEDVFLCICVCSKELDVQVDGRGSRGDPRGEDIAKGAGRR